MRHIQINAAILPVNERDKFAKTTDRPHYHIAGNGQNALAWRLQNYC
jgi:hypothetical protein